MKYSFARLAKRIFHACSEMFCLEGEADFFLLGLVV